ncbi:DUF6538 domain-containing protein [Xanthobacter sp. YC-JY1]|uniref:DUF6538 domain-containing protein n=1 Tax=Xanthobacter sp. YC-JY1 TaxID=2419844 RepID=UPI00352D1527
MRKIKSLRSRLLRTPATQGGEMARDSRLFKRAGKWTFRVRVPADIQGKIGKKEIWKSLGDVPHAEARRLARIESVKADALFARLARPHPRSLSAKSPMRISSTWR